MPHFKLLFQTEFLAAVELKGRDVTLTIARVDMETLRREGDDDEDASSERRPVVHFEEMQRRPKKDRKRLVLNVTNAKTIAKLYGNATEDWTGKPITLYPTTCKAFGEVVECIRVRKQRPSAKTQRSSSKPANEPAPDREPGADDERDPRDADAP